MNKYEKLMQVQGKLKVSKENYNDFGKYKYRSCEDILEGVKPLLKEVGAIVTLSDSVEMIGNRTYIKATATFIDTEKGDVLEVSAFAREDETKKGMDLAQVTGSVSSYARKYALNGLFCIDDTKDSDATNTGDTSKTHTEVTGATEPHPEGNKTTLTEKQVTRAIAIGKAHNIPLATIKKQIQKDYNVTDIAQLSKTQYDELCTRLENAGGNK